LIKGSFTVSAGAAAKLKASISPKHGDKYMAFRVTPSPKVATQVRMMVERQAPTDIAVVSQGAKILFLSSEAAELLDGVIMDYQVTGQTGKFTLSKKRPD
jgi:Fe-S cluster assembly iron-binding protein IscA